MTPKTDYARNKALKGITDIINNNKYSNIVLKHILNDIKLDEVQKAFIKENIYGVIENLYLIDWIVRNYSRVKVARISPVVLNIIRLGVYQILFMDTVPDWAAVDESVKLVKKYSHKGSISFVNAILRTISREKNKIVFPDRQSSFSEHISIKYSFPTWLVEMWIEQFGKEYTEKLCAASNERPNVTIRINTLKISKKQLKNMFKGKGVITENSRYFDDALYIKYKGSIEQLEEYKKGYFSIQDEGSILVSILMDPKPGESILDMCSAPGGKAIHSAQLMGNEGSIIARDMHAHKIDIVRSNARRMGISIIKSEIKDGLIFDKSSKDSFNRVLLDAPCTGFGVIRKKPDIKLRRIKDDIESISNIQRQLLKNAGSYVKPGGILVYSTCTINNKENQDIVNRFLLDDGSFRIYNPSIPAKEAYTDNFKSGSFYMALPHIHYTDGFFIAILKKCLFRGRVPSHN